MKRFLMPREHGAYAQLLFPLLSGLVIGGAPVAAVALALGAVALFLAYEPTVVLLGARGVRLQREQEKVARRQLLVLLPLALLLGSGGLLLASPQARLLALIPAGLCLLLAPLVPTKRVKTLAGETLVLGALAAMHLPLAAAGGAAGLRLWAPAVVWVIGFFAATLAVHAIKARQKQRDPGLRAAALGTSAIAVVGALMVATAMPALRIAAFAVTLPLAAVLAVNLARVHPRALKRVGWTIVAADTFALALIAFL